MSRRDWDDGDDDFSHLGIVATDRAEVGEGPRVFRVNGPPGTGKTTWLTRQCDLAADKYGGGAVVVASLTRAAAAEVAGRKTKLPRQNIGTLHSHAYHALGRPDIAESAKGLKEWNDWCGSASLRISSTFAADPENATPEQNVPDTRGGEMLQALGVLRARMVDRRMYPPGVARFADKWEAFKQERSYLDFTDLIERAVDEVDLEARPAVVLLDEAQDMSHLDMRLAVKWGMAAKQLVVVGDADQNLYQWRGSDPEAFYGLGGVDKAHIHVSTLSQSYRVPRAVHAAAVAVVERIPGRENVQYEPRDAEGSVDRVSMQWSDPERMVKQLEADLDESPGTVMVLASCGYMLQPLVSVLRKRGTPFHNPYRTNHGGWNPLRGGRRLLSFLRPSADVFGEDARTWTWKEAKAWVEVLQSKGVLQRGSKTILERENLVDRFKDDLGDREVDITKLLGMFVSDEHRDGVWNLDITWWEQHLKHKDRKAQQYPLQIARRYGAKRLLEEPRLVIGTIHSVKGGEADTVYVFPDLSSVAYWEGYRKPGEGRDAIHRQFYVAMTRAKQDLKLCSPTGAGAVKWP